MPDNKPESSPTATAAPRPHVLHVVDADTFGRFSLMFRHLALALSTEGLRVSVMSDAPAATATFEGTSVEHVPVRGLRGWAGWRAGRRCARAAPGSVALVHLWGTAALPFIGRWALRQGLPVFVHLLALSDLQRLPRRRRWENLHVLPGCAGFRDLARQHRLAPQAPGVWPPAILLPEPCPAEPASDRTLGVVWTGRVTPDAGLDLLVEAVAALRQRGGDIQVVLLGDGPAVRPLRETIRTLGAQDCFSLVAAGDWWPRALYGADVCVVPAPQTELDLAPLMAMALGKIVIASRGQPAEWFVEDQTAWQFTPGKTVELAYHLARVVENPRHVERLRASASEYVRRHHNIGRLVNGLLEVYRRTLGIESAASVRPSAFQEPAT